MKNSFIRILVVLMIAVSLIQTASAAEQPVSRDEEWDEETSSYRYYENLEAFLQEYLSQPAFLIENYAETYKELYIHYCDTMGEEPDWALIYCPIMPVPMPVLYGVSIGDRLIYSLGGSTYFDTGYMIYDVKKDLFISITNVTINQILIEYPDLEEAVKSVPSNILIGDVDDDKEITILDATIIQRGLAGFDEELIIYDEACYPVTEISVRCFGGAIPKGYGDNVEKQIEEHYVADYDRNGEVTILDATAIQRHLVGIK